MKLLSLIFILMLSFNAASDQISDLGDEIFLLTPSSMNYNEWKLSTKLSFKSCDISINRKDKHLNKDKRYTTKGKIKARWIEKVKFVNNKYQGLAVRIKLYSDSLDGISKKDGKIHTRKLSFVNIPYKTEESAKKSTLLFKKLQKACSSQNNT